ncbi:MAG: serine/threonine protein kinase [Gammaproteobacteria bacterium]|nr:serine/threonine protein kinase [Gammaproteobacteria bacterium]
MENGNVNTGEPEAAARGSHPYDALKPEVVLDAVDSLGLVTDGRLLPLNSYENRVYQVGIEEAEPIIAKFYRPERWTNAQILEEHEFALELAASEIPMVPPLERDGETLFEFQDFRFAIFPRRGGHAPELDNDDHLEWLGRFLARIHAVGSARPFDNRPVLTDTSVARDSLAFLRDGGWLPDYLAENFVDACERILERCDTALTQSRAKLIRLHGDCHPGNILWRDGPHFVDLDDCLTGPAIQDLWMLLSGERLEREQQLWTLLDGYEEFHDFDPAEIQLIEPLRGLRMINFIAWLARRWDDPAFPPAFPWFNSVKYWEEQLNNLREQVDALDEPSLRRHPYDPTP